MKPLCILIAALLCGCAAPKLNTASGRPEVTIQAPSATVRTMLASELVNRGYVITKSEDLLIEGERDAGTAAAVFLATPSDPTARVRASLNIIGADGNVRVVLRTFLIASGRNQGETTGSLAKSQQWLDEIKARCESK